jgi:hypothetical protein
LTGVPEGNGDPEQVVLVDESGAEVRFLLHDAFDSEGATYYLVEAEADPEQVLLLRETEGTLESVGPEEFDRILAQLESDDA